MKRNHILGLNLLIFMAALPLLIFTCTALSLVSYLAFNSLDAAVSSTARHAGPVRIRTIPALEPVSLAPVTTGSELHPAGVIEDTVPEPVAQTEAAPPAEAPTEPVGEAEMPTGPSSEEEPMTIPETTIPAEMEASAEAVTLEAALPETAVDGEDMTTSAAAVPDPAPVDQYEAPIPAENLPLVEAPPEPAPPEIAAKPEPPPQSAPAEPSFVPDSSFFDQLLEQVD